MLLLREENIFWKIYFWLALVLFTLDYLNFRLIQTTRDLTIASAIGLAVFLGILSGLHGFAWSKRHFNPIFWKFFLTFVLVWIILGRFLPEHDIYQGSVTNQWPMWLKIFDSIISVVCSFFWMLALYLYAFKRPWVWKPELNTVPYSLPIVRHSKGKNDHSWFSIRQ